MLTRLENVSSLRKYVQPITVLFSYFVNLQVEVYIKYYLILYCLKCAQALGFRFDQPLIANRGAHYHYM